MTTGSASQPALKVISFVFILSIQFVSSHIKYAIQSIVTILGLGTNFGPLLWAQKWIFGKTEKNNWRYTYKEAINPEILKSDHPAPLESLAKN